jgi:serine/threonine protein kinase
MTPDRWAVVERLYHDALTRPAHGRVAFLAEACAADEALRHEVESLLARSAPDADFLEEPAIALAAKMSSAPGVSLLTGRRIGVYDVLAPLGAGGMGEVYRARDTKLGREVAIKILPRDYTSDPDRLARFEREARMLATLNHPHIGAIYGFEESDAVPDSGQAALRALVLELVEGETLAERITRAEATGPGLPVKEALDIARQIAEALDAAHEKGIVHRDLKPANIKITPDGIVKVLDFGLAKLDLIGAESSETSSQSPTVTYGGTRDGIILGTAAYMSPEQARGQAVDKRTDIWAFGCVLYEMLTGRAAFAGKTVSDTIAAILEREPDWKALPPPLPPSVRHLLRRCFEKDARQRLRDIGDAKSELREQPPEETTAASAVSRPKWREAFRARDRKLGREVAIKILPRALTADPDRLARFEREASVLLTLNHPHIGAVYGFDEGDGSHALVLELVEGQTLADRIARGPLPIDEALIIAGQIAEALDAAHEKGIVHRGLTPATIKITPYGVVKVLDFGLAKLEPTGAVGSEALSQSSTVVVGSARDRIIPGTPAYTYMSPEQARGEPDDKRTDIWAFGGVLYEMLTGRAAFLGDTLSDTIAAILEREPEWCALPAHTPTGIGQLLRRCLDKDPKRRLRDIGDARLEIDEAQAEPLKAIPGTHVVSRRMERLAWLVALGLVMIVAWALARWGAAPSTTPLAERRVEISTPPTTDPPSLAISPDGPTLAFVATSHGQPRVWLRPFNAVSARAVPETRTVSSGKSGSRPDH